MDFWKVYLKEGNPLNAKWVYLEKTEKILFNEIREFDVLLGDFYYVHSFNDSEIVLRNPVYRVIPMREVSMIDYVDVKVILK